MESTKKSTDEQKQAIHLVEIHMPSVDSTNTWIKKHHREFDAQTTVRVTASEQTRGRGRFERRWVSPKGKNIYLSYLLNPSLHAEFDNPMHPMCSAIVDLLARRGLKGDIKWPNDILIKGKKIGGILCETIDCRTILGVGLNVNMPSEVLQEIDQPATSLLNELGIALPIKSILNELDSLFFHSLFAYSRKEYLPL